jgi:hypothetical protein
MKPLSFHVLLSAGVLVLSGCGAFRESRPAPVALVEDTSIPSLNSRPGSWISSPREYPGAANVVEVSKQAYWQAQATVLPTAIERLEAKTFVQLSEDEAAYFAGPHYRRQPGTEPYLVRAVFWNYTGDFALLLEDGCLYVGHHSLGHVDGETKLPLIVNLKRAPKKVHTYLSAAL